MATRTRLKRIRKAAIIAVAVLIALPLLATLALLTRPVREEVLEAAALRLRETLPGRLEIGRAAWPHPGEVEIAELLWTVDGDTLLDLRRARLDVDLPALARRDLRVRSLEAEVRRLDAPGITSALDDGRPRAERTGDGGVPWLRTGALPPLPSVALDSLSLACARLLAAPGAEVLGLRVAGGVDLGHGRDPRLRLDAAARDAADAWTLDGLRLDWAPADGRFDGDGRLDLGVMPSLSYTLAGTGPDAFRLTLDVDGSDAGLAADGRLARGADTRRLDLDGDVRLPGGAELADWGLVAAPPPLDPARGTFTLATLWTDDGPEAELDLALAPDARQDGARLRAGWAAGALRVETLSWSAPGLRLDGAGDVTDGSVRAVARLELDGLDGLRPFVPALSDPAATLPDSLAASLDLRVDGPLPAPGLSADLRAGARRDELRLDRLETALTLDAGWRAARLDWSLRAHGLGAAGAAELERDDAELRAVHSPVTVAMGDPPAPAAPATRVRYVLADSSLTVGPLRIDGAAGEHVLEGAWDPSGGRVRFASSWPRPPEALALALPDSVRARIAPLWDEGIAWGATGDVRYGARDGRIEADADLVLPGPRQLAALAPPPARVDDLGPIRARVTVRGAVDDLRAELDLSETDWIDTGRAAASVRADTLVMESATLTALGLVLDAAGELRGETLSGAAELVVPDASLLSRLDLPLADPDLSLRLAVEAAGPRDRPTIDARLSGAYRDTAVVVPELAARLRLDGERLEARADLPAGATLSGRPLDALVVAYDGAVPGRGEGRVSARAAAGDSRAAIGARLAAGPPWVLEPDTLVLAHADRDLSLDAPARLAYDPASGALALEGLSLSGALGRLRLDARGAPEDLELETEFALIPPPELIPETLPDSFRPAEISGRARRSGGTLSARATVTGLRLGTREDVRLELEADGPETGPDLRARLVAGRDTFARAAAAVPADLAARIESGDPAPLDAELVLTGLPLPTPGPASPDREVRLDGHVRLGGTHLAPTGEAVLSAVATGWEELADHRLELRGRLEAPTGGAGALAADLELTRAGARLAGGRLVLPGTVTVSPAGFAPDPDGRLVARLETRGLALDEFAPLLPAAVGLQGVLDVDVSAEGAVDDPALAGDLSLVGGRATLPDGSWIALGGAASLSGRLVEPVLSGDLEIGGGVLRLPDPPRLLHPLHARPALWDAAGAPVAAAADTAATATAGPPKIRPVTDVRLSIPGGLWLRGQGLEIELAGDLELRSDADGRPDVLGDLEARRGTYRFLGRLFSVERGAVIFEGEDALDPALDIALSTRLDGAIYRVAFGGTLQRPVLALTSEPELPEGDIMAVLLFGRPLDELSGDQEGVVRDRATDLVTAFGTAQLEQRLARQLRVDMVSLRRGDGPEGADALVIGKYLSQRVLLKYEQALDEWATFVVNLEYFLSRRFKLETMISRRAQSAATVNWSLDY